MLTIGHPQLTLSLAHSPARHHLPLAADPDPEPEVARSETRPAPGDAKQN